MFVIQDCSICFEDYDEQRIPHSISCGHVFCRPCLESLMTSSPHCPNCRMSFGRKAIRKVVCTLQDPPGLDASTLSEAEMIMWQAIKSAVESVDGPEQRRSLVRDNSRLAVRDAGFSGNLLVALDMMRLLVEVESTNRGLTHNVEAARAFEESPRDRIPFLEAQLDGRKTRSNLQDVQALLSEVQTIKSSMRIIDETSSKIARQSSSTEPIPDPIKPHTSLTLDRTRPAFIPEQTRDPSRSGPAPARNPPAAEPQPPRVSWISTTSVRLTTAFTSFTHSARWPSLGSSWQNNIQSSPQSMQPAPRPAPRSQPAPAPAQVRWQAGLSFGLLSQAPNTRESRSTTAAYDYTAENSNEITVRAGERIEILSNLNDLRWGYYLVLCRARGGTGYLPRNYLNLS